MAAASLATSRPNTTRTVAMPEPRQVEPEDVRIVLVVGVQRQAPVERGDGGQRPDHQAPTTHEHLDAAGDRQTPAQVRDPRGQPVATAQLLPRSRDGAGCRCGSTSSGTSSRWRSSRLNSVSIHTNAPFDPLVKATTATPSSGATSERGVEARKDPVVPDHAMPAGLAAGEAEPPTRHAGIRLVVGLEHRRQRRRLEDRSVPVGTTAHQRRREASDVAGGGVDPAGSAGRSSLDRGPPSRRAARGCSRSPGVTRPDRTGRGRCPSCRAARRSARGSSARGRPAHVLDDLTERGEPVVGVREGACRARRPPADRRGSTRPATAAVLRTSR